MAVYAHEDFAGIALYVRGPVQLYDLETEQTVDDADRVRVVMVGDDREHVVFRDDLRAIDDLDYCLQCGQIGCAHDGRDRDAF